MLKQVLKPSVFFLVVLLLIPVFMISFMNFTGKISEKENKALAKLPDVFITHEKFPQKMDAYIEDRIGFKFDLISLEKAIPTAAGALQDTLQGNVVKGKDEWLFYNDSQYNETLEDYLRTARFSDEELGKINTAFKKEIEWCKERGIELFIVAAPNKHNIYPEYYSPLYSRLDKSSRLEQFLEMMRTYGVNFVPVLDVLKASKADKQIYYKQDTHWNTFGAYIAYNEIMNAIKKKFPDVQIIPQSEIQYTSDEYMKGDLERMLHGGNIQNNDKLQTPVFNNDAGLNTITTEEDEYKMGNNRVTEANVKGPSVLFIHDSFGNDLLPYLERSFPKLITKRAWHTSPQKYKELIEKDKPDVIILEIQERYLTKIANGAFDLM